MENTAKAIGQRIRLIRQELKLTQKQFAAQIGVSDKTVSTYEVGDATPPIQILKAIVRMGNKSCDWLILGFEPVVINMEMSEDEIKLIQYYRQAEKEDKKVILRVAENSKGGRY